MNILITKPAASTIARSFFDLFLHASQRKFDVVVFWALDRFTREGVLQTLTYLNRLSNYGVAFRSFTEQYLDSCGMFREAVISILATIAKQERIRISERVRAGVARVRANGNRWGRPPIGQEKKKQRAALDGVEILRLRTQERLSWAEIVAATGASRASCQRAALRASKTLSTLPV
jgi:DNA invertase Pin-like site-specific DNA recombinase